MDQCNQCCCTGVLKLILADSEKFLAYRNIEQLYSATVSSGQKNSSQTIPIRSGYFRVHEWEHQ